MHKRKNILDYFSSPVKKEKNLNEKYTIKTNTMDSEYDQKSDSVIGSDINQNLNEIILNSDINESVDVSISNEDNIKSDNNIFDNKIRKRSNYVIDDDSLSDISDFISYSPVESYENKKSNLKSNKKNKNTKKIPVKISKDLSLNSVEIPTPQKSEDSAERYKFLIDIRDSNKRKPTDPDYDPTTLFIPEEYYEKFTQFEKQFWDIKSKYFDTIVCFKKGKFYELYENDAEIGSKLFNLKITERVNMKMAGFPESTFDYWAGKFIEHGYKLARVDQSENMIAKNMRERENKTKKSQIINRELKEIITQGTPYNLEHITDHNSIYLAIFIDWESENIDTDDNKLSILLYDASINHVFLKTIENIDEENNSSPENNKENIFSDKKYIFKAEIDTILIRYDVREIISNFKFNFNNSIQPIKSDIKIVNEKLQNVGENKCFQYLVNYMNYLKREDFLKTVVIQRLENISQPMIIDGISLENLEIIRNNYDKTSKYTLFDAIDYTSTPFGKRMLKKWLLHPLTDINEINKRQSISEFIGNLSNFDELKDKLKKFDDLERYLGKLKNLNPKISDIENVLKNLNFYIEFCNLFFSNNKIKIESFDILKENIHNKNHEQNNILTKNDMQKNNSESSFIDEFESFESNKTDDFEFNFDFPNIKNILIEFEKQFLIENNEIHPGNENFEMADLNEELNSIEEKLNSYIKIQRNKLNCEIKYKDLGKEIFQLEISSEIKVPNSYYIVSSTKNTNRYYTKELKVLINEYVEINEKIFQAKNTLIRNAANFLNNHFNIFSKICNILAELDIYFSFNIFSNLFETTTPEFDEYVELLGFRNPIFPKHIPNDLILKDQKTLILTGPNMGGKSTLLRSIALNSILAQIGMKVPCKKYKSIIFDKIFTRIGANDDLKNSMSTFMVELNETSKILKNATKNSLVIIDELGRGTSIKDGECIALATLKYLQKINPVILFSTHYHKIAINLQNVKKSYMDVIVNDNIIFLYKLVDGVCINSYGLDVARLAGVPDQIIEDAINNKKRLDKF